MNSYLAYLLPLWDWKKFANAFRILSSYALSRITRRYLVWGKPYTFIIEPTAHCNLRCPQCPVGLQTLLRPQGYLTFDDYRRIIDQIADYTWVLLLYFQGESFMNPDIIRMIEYAYSRKMFTVISTNGTRLANPQFARELAASPLGRLILSVDGATEETYRIYRQAGKFDRVIRGIRQFIQARRQLGKKFPLTDLQFIVMRHNEHEMDAIRRLGRELGVDRVIFKSPQIYDFENAEAILPRNEAFRRYIKRNGTYRLKGSYSGYCKKIWYGSVITWDKTVIPCCFDKDAQYVLGNLDQADFEEVWEGENYHRFRKMVVRNRDALEMCRNCTEGLRIFFRK
ncbi:MAG: radical SAM protein [Calditrichaeota bacterium]|nr:MAG: radical SAM protein [Calditrichota bacterium]